MKNQNRTRTARLVQLALLIAIELLFAFTPLGYLHVGIVEITFMTIPVALGAMMLGAGASALLGAIFGLTSFIQCFGMSAFGGLILAINPFLTFLLCFFPRLLMGWLTGLICKAMCKVDKTRVFAFIVTALSAAVLNTAFFVLGFFLCFHTATLDFGGGTVVDFSQMNIIDILVFLAGINGLIEAGVCTVVSAAVGRTLVHFLPNRE